MGGVWPDADKCGSVSDVSGSSGDGAGGDTSGGGAGVSLSLVRI